MSFISHFAANSWLTIQIYSIKNKFTQFNNYIY